MRLPIGILVAAFASMAASGAVKAPDAAALDAAREEVRAILANDFTALNAGQIALVDVADHAASLSAAENSPARLRVLQEGAFNLYREAGALGRAAERRVPFWINLGSDAEFEFVACPAGSFTMGCDGDRASPAFRHKVNLPRPFWIAKFQTTKRLYSTFRRVRSLTKEEKLYGGMDIPHGGLSRKDMDDFCAFLTMCNKDRLPEGYVFRLPTDAEWEYALNANCVDPADPYVRFKKGDTSVAEEISVSWKAVNVLRKAYGLKPIDPGRNGQGAVFAVGTKRPNAWGIYDMLGNGHEYVLDTVPASAVRSSYGEGVLNGTFDFGYSDEETEPLRCSNAADSFVLTRGGVRYKRFGANWYNRIAVSQTSHQNGHFTFRIVLAPDILRERNGGAVK